MQSLQRLLKVLLPVLVVVVAILIARALIAQRAPLKSANEEPEHPLVEVVTVSPGQVELTLHSEGSVRSKNRLQLTGDVAGRVSWIAPGFQTGEVVDADSVLVKVDPTDYRLALAQAKLSLREAELNLADARTRFSITSPDHPQLKRAQAQVEAANAQIDKAERDLAHTEVRSPFRALVDTRNVAPGQFITPSTPLGELLDVGTVEISLPLTVEEFALLQDGQEHPVTLSARIGSRTVTWQARLGRLHQQLDQQTRVAYAVVDVSDPYYLDADRDSGTPPLRIGQFVHAEIGGVHVRGAVRIPAGALFEDRYVFVVDDEQKLQRREVTVLRHEPHTVVISGGIGAGDRIVLSRLDLMTDGMVVRTTPVKTG